MNNPKRPIGTLRMALQESVEIRDRHTVSPIDVVMFCLTRPEAMAVPLFQFVRSQFLSLGEDIAARTLRSRDLDSDDTVRAIAALDKDRAACMTGV